MDGRLLIIRTPDIKTDEVVDDEKSSKLDDLVQELSSIEEGECESCAV